LIIDAGQPILEGELLPCGPLRERWSAVRDASAIVLVDRAGGARGETMRESLRLRLRRWGFSGPLFSALMRSSGVVPYASGDEQPLRVLSGARVSICSGIGQPGAFREMVTLAGATVCDEWIFGDHHDYTREEWGAIAARARQRGAEIIVTTEKDLVKLADWPAAGPPVAALRIEMNVEPEREWHDWLTAQRLLPGDPPEPNGAAGAGRSNRPADLLCGAPRPGGG
jgi:tetraacyldisaccharide 4'-kinase